MEQKTLTGYERKELKKGPSRRLRREGKIPAIIYGHDTPKPISVDRKEFHAKFKNSSASTILTIKVGKKEYEVLVKGFQEDYIHEVITHIDFYELERGKLLKTKIPVHVEGSAVGVREGGLLEQRIHELEVECLPKDIPEVIVVDVSDLGIGESIHVRDLKVSEDVKVLNLPDQTIVSITSVKEVVEPEAGEEEVAEGEEAEAEAPAGEEEEA